MRILQINKYLFRRDGVTAVFEDTIRALRARGHEVMVFGQAHPAEFTAGLPGRRIAPIDLNTAGETLRGRLRALARILLGAGACGPLRRLLVTRTPDIAHLHNIYHHIAAPVIAVLARRGIPAVMTAHDYKLCCPCYTRRRDAADTCSLCLRGGPFAAVRHRCVKHSAAASCVCWLEAIIHRRHWARLDAFVAPSRFMAEALRATGVPARRIVVIPNAVTAPPPAPAAGVPPRTVLFLGRLYPEKGADVLLRAWARIAHRRTTLVIAGEGPERPRLERLAADLHARSVRFAGFLTGDARTEALRDALAVAVPSVWYENCPMTILEAFAAGKAVVASRIGGIPELLAHGEQGLLAPPGDAGALATQMARIIHDEPLRRRLGEAARARVCEAHAPALYSARLERLYARVIDASRHGR